jgi:PHD and RING finger domain-containing protein 1
VDNDDRGYESEAEGQDDEHVRDDEGEVVSGHASLEYSGDEGNRDSFEENLLKTEGESEEVGASSQPSAPSKTEDGDTEAASLPSTSSQAAVHMSDGSNDEQSAGCPICLEKIITQEVGITDTCNHSFCVACLHEWSKHANTCPVDRQTFNFILVRHHLKGKIVSRIPVEPSAQEFEVEDDVLESLTFCEVCGESDREDGMVFCYNCSTGYHTECLENLQYDDFCRYCPCFYCISFISF